MAQWSVSQSVARHTRMDRLDRGRRDYDLPKWCYERPRGRGTGLGRWRAGGKESGIDVTIDHKIADLFIHHHRVASLRDSKTWYSSFAWEVESSSRGDYQDGVGKTLPQK